MNPATRYHPFLVTLHWLLAVLIVAMLLVGFFLLAPMPNGDPGKIDILRAHMIAGVTILALMVVRFVARLSTAKPARAPTGYPLLDRIAPITHYGFYVLILLMVSTGFATAIVSGIKDIAFGGSQAPLPPSLTAYPPFIGHIAFAALLSGLILLHVAAALYHQFVRQDGLFRRMWFGRRNA